VELSEKAVLRPDREPYDRDFIGFFGPDEPSEKLIISGYPDEKVIEHERIDLGHLGGRRPLHLFLATMEVHSMPGIRWEEEPPTGRGVHVFLSPQSTQHLFVRQSTEEVEGGTAATPEPFGMSGGPLARHNGRILVGLARGCADYLNGLDQWCEPVVEAVRLLCHHEDPAVSLAARDIIKRCRPPSKAGQLLRRCVRKVGSALR
jgi:hypothetical protein